MTNTSNPQLRKNWKCNPRFADVSRKIKNQDTYQKAIIKSLSLFKVGVFVTLTTDVQLPIQTRRNLAGYEFDATGSGCNLWSANRLAYNDWHSWYERQCHLFGDHIPCIRVVEFQKNGLVYTHVLLFGVEENANWEKLTKDWGPLYNQRFMINHVYKIENRDNKWEWAKQDEHPEDTKGRDPADYFCKYIKTAQEEKS
jgi:hypothetical protein